MSADDVLVTVQQFGTRSNDYLRGFEEGIAAYRAALRAAGYAVVPVEATDQMLPDAWRMVRHCGGQGVDHDCLRSIYRAMIAAVDTPGGDGVE